MTKIVAVNHFGALVEIDVENGRFGTRTLVLGSLVANAVPMAFRA